MRLVVVPTSRACQIYLRDGQRLVALDEVDHPEELAAFLMRIPKKPHVVLAGLDASTAWVDAVIDFADILVIPEPWLAGATRNAPERRARRATRLAEMHSMAPITRHDCDPQLSLAIPF